ncbi:hypothetical protein AB0F46_39780 [Streptomyces sp. NPDC026665]|uniref:hypothetical protein n=1 Tax=Streptomyces sp. NPDC026665 TaxID=3154798 RepID=UPI0034075FBE
MDECQSKGLRDGGMLPDVETANSEDIAAAIEALSALSFEIRTPVAMQGFLETQLIRVHEISNWIAAVCERMAIDASCHVVRIRAEETDVPLPGEISHAMLVGMLVNLGGSYVMPACAMEAQVLEGVHGLHTVTMELLPNDVVRLSIKDRLDADDSEVTLE